jgi:hypothetical protein
LVLPSFTFEFDPAPYMVIGACKVLEKNVIDFISMVFQYSELFNIYKFGVIKNVQSILLQFQAHVTKKTIGTRKVKGLSLNKNHNKKKTFGCGK